jgi:hypothetical protein
MLKFRRRTLAGAGALAAACIVTGISVGPADAATARPASVSGFAVANGSVTTGGATFTWGSDAGAASYRVVIVNASTPTAPAAYNSDYTLTGTSVTVSALAPGTAYEAKISAENSAGPSEWSGWVLFYTTAAPGRPGPSGVVFTKTFTLVSDPSGTKETIPTGGSFRSKAESIGTVTLPRGTYLLNLNFMATPNDANATGSVFPQAFVYDGTTIASDFSNDLFNVGSGALAPYNKANASDQVNSYYSGTSVITVQSRRETLDVYAFGYDSDQGAGSYELNSATLTATALNAARGSF